MCACMSKKENKLFIYNVQNDDFLLKYILKFFDRNTLGRELTFLVLLQCRLDEFCFSYPQLLWVDITRSFIKPQRKKFSDVRSDERADQLTVPPHLIHLLRNMFMISLEHRIVWSCIIMLYPHVYPNI